MAGLNQTPLGERIHIAFFGRRNAGKSSLVNAFTGQSLAIVSDVKGTTTDPVYKAMELLPIGPVMIIDTPGLDDEGALRELRVKKAKQVLNKTDVAVLVVDSSVGVTDDDIELLSLIKAKEIPFVVAMNKCDLGEGSVTSPAFKDVENIIFVSALSGINVNELKELVSRVISKANGEKKDNPLVSDLVSLGDLAVLVVPIDKSAPKGRLILPQQQVIRDLLDSGASAVVCRDNELEGTLEKLKESPKMVITDSQVFGFVSKIVPENIPLTSFSILMARHKGDLDLVAKGAFALDDIKDGDKILISEGCTHHRQCEDIGTVKLPRMIKAYTKAEPEFVFTSGSEFSENLEEYKLVVHCGGCMLNEKEMRYRQRCAVDQGVHITNYGILIAYINGILKRSLEALDKG
jgi:[FeFe] hydrogenase H-cluster maturation GTPase HydF